MIYDNALKVNTNENNIKYNEWYHKLYTIKYLRF